MKTLKSVNTKVIKKSRSNALEILSKIRAMLKKYRMDANSKILIKRLKDNTVLIHIVDLNAGNTTDDDFTIIKIHIG